MGVEKAAMADATRLDPLVTQRSRRLRCDMTDAERRLWYGLRKRQLQGRKFRRQHPIGEYIVDFVCLDARLIVEVDGGQHGERVEYDSARTRWLEGQGYRVLRFWNDEVLQGLSPVLDLIWQALARGR
jgi:very-short-patch-repair endonuclease